MPFPLFLNELSLLVQDKNHHEKLQLILGFVHTLQAVKNKRSDIELHSSDRLDRAEFGEGSYLCTILTGANYLDQWRFIKSLVQRAPWSIEELHAEVKVFNERAVGFSLAYENDSIAISLVSHDGWKRSEIQAEVAGRDELLPHISEPDHANRWEQLLSEYGIAVSASCIVFDSDFKVLMYKKEHNPPHVHIVIDQFRASINIRNLDVMAGKLPAHMLSQVKDWVEQNKEVLLLNWGRCRAGQAPIRLAN